MTSNFFETFLQINLHISNKYITFAFVKYNELFKILKKDGWFIVRQKGSHVVMQHPTRTKQIIVPYHAGKEVKKGLLSSLMKQANIKITKR